MEEEYNIDLKCANCGRPTWNVKIPVGMSIKEFGLTKSIICKYCGCPVIKVKEEKKEETTGD